MVDPALTAAYDYPLPAERIAQEPLAERDASRLLLVRPDGGLEDRRFAELPQLLSAGDLLVVNDTRVRAARLRGRRTQGGAAELLVLRRLADGRYRCLVRPARRLDAGARVVLDGGLVAMVGERSGEHPGARAVALIAGAGEDPDGAIERAGTVPLPPYIRRPLSDPQRYQTVFGAGSPATSAAAPTAGLHFTAAVLGALRRSGVALASVRLEVGPATFAPMRGQHVDEHAVPAEAFVLPVAAAEAVAAARARGGRVVAVGTTSARVLESCAGDGGHVCAGSGETRLFLRPGTSLRCVDGLLTNFHAPRSSLLALLACVAGSERWRVAYDHALAGCYRFLSFGDCMLCWRPTSGG